MASAVALVVTGIANPTQVAAGGAFAVDNADVDSPGACVAESWVSAAGNSDFAAAVNSACVVNVFKPVELSAQLSRTRSDGNWATSITPKAKTNLVPTAIGSFGVGFTAGASFDIINRENTSVVAVVPVTLRLSEVMQINLNGGWLWDPTVERHYLTYGAGFDWNLTEKVTLTTEIFGLTGIAYNPHIIQPRFQTGLRFRPIETFSFDVIFGHNLTGENANWITIGSTISFPPSAK